MLEVPLPDMPNGPSPEDLLIAGLIKRMAQLEATAADIAAEILQIKARLRALGPGRHEYPTGTVIVTPQKRFDPAQAAEVLRAIHPDLVSRCSISKVDAKLTAKAVSGEVYEQCQKIAGDDKVEIK